MKKDNITKIIYDIFKQMNIKIKLIPERLIKRVLPRLLFHKRASGMSGAGFVLPTVTMVTVVVLLLTFAISLRSFDRAEDARNVKTNQAVLASAVPAMDRAKAKLQELLVTNPPTTSTPSEETIEEAFKENESKESKFNFPDEERLIVSYKNEDEAVETIDTAWRFPVDTNGDGDNDAYTIYGIFFKTPGDKEARTPLQARAFPRFSQDGNCQGSLATNKEWIPINGTLKKSFFVYAVTVPNNSQKTGVSALEYELDWSRTPLTNNAVVYEDDLEIAPSPEFNLNGRMFTNSNLFIAPTGSNSINLRLVSSPSSCFYSADNSKIFVGGNLVYGRVEEEKTGSGTVTIDLMNGNSVDVNKKTLNASNDSVDGTKAGQAAYNSAAYRTRIDALAERATALTDNDLPQEVKDEVNQGRDKKKALENYFKKLTRKVPNAETDCKEDNFDSNSCIGITGYNGTKDELRPEDNKQDTLVLPNSTKTGVTLVEKQLLATDPEELDTNTQYQIGDRIEVGNNLPQKYWDKDEKEFLTTQKLSEKWLKPDSTEESDKNRERTSQAKTIADVGSTDRGGFWEESAAEKPDSKSKGVGGLRIITGSGIYASNAPGTSYRRNDLSFLPPPPKPSNMPANYDVVWPDTMPMSPAGDGERKGDLQMRATVLYHYANDPGENPQESNGNTLEPQEPIACISSYYDPSTAKTAQNEQLPDGRSNNGRVYPKPSSTIANQRSELDIQSRLVFPDGRLVNEPLKVALEHYDEAERPNYDLADKAAIDAELCALDILDKTITPGNSVITNLSDGDIREISFLDARQVKAVVTDHPDTEVDETFTVNADKIFLADDSNTTQDESEVIFYSKLEQPTYELPLEERQPLEIRATLLNLDALRKATLSQSIAEGPEEGGKEYLLPMSGIIYASRNDALPDRSDPTSSYDELKTSPYDLKLDPSRRPNGFMLINGDKLARGSDSKSYDEVEKITKEKGLVFVSNNPVYIQGDFNVHEKEEFIETLENNWGNFYNRKNIDKDFACRKGDPRNNCNGESWRAATVLADAITLLSDNWRAGYRNEGDFDLRNNGGNGIVGPSGNPAKIKEKRKFNGFFANNYATNGLSSGATIFTDANTSVNLTDKTYTKKEAGKVNSSYFNNFVTPVQRRIDGFPEYVMEVCQNLPVYACGPGDWKVWRETGTPESPTKETVYKVLLSDSTFEEFFDEGSLRGDIKWAEENMASGIEAGTLQSGTTATVGAEVQRFPRRVAFLRNRYNQLELDDDNRPIPIGVNLDGNVQAYPYANTALPRNTENNVLWFRTTTEPDEPFTGQTYLADKPLFYLGYDKDDPDNSGQKLLLPPTPSIKVGGEEYNLKGADSYSLCNSNGQGSQYVIMQSGEDFNNTGSCGVKGDIDNFRNALKNLTQTDPINWDGKSDVSLTDDNEDGIVVYDLPASIDGADEGITIELKGDSNTIFVLKRDDGNLTFNNITMELGNVNPNNIFWVLQNGSVTFGSSPGSVNLAGNFLGNSNTVTVNDNTKILGGRFLGFNNLTYSGNVSPVPVPADAGIDIRAISSQANPTLVPVLQIHEPDATAGSDKLNGGKAAQDTAWMVEAKDTEFNLVAGAGDTPSREGQGNGGVQNLVRFLENWELPKQKTTKIFGSFIQLGRSKYATAPQQQIIRNNEGKPSPLPYKYSLTYETGAAGGILGFQAPPARNWGFDVGLLSQPPDLFAQKFTLPLPLYPDEYFREVDFDDPWVQGLLCSKTKKGETKEHRPEGTDCDKYE